MKTIKLLVLGLALTTLSSCSESAYDISGDIQNPPPVYTEVYKYDLEEYYEPTVKISNVTDYSGNYMYVGQTAFTLKRNNYETLDTLIIDGKNKRNLKEIRFFMPYDNPYEIWSTYKEIKYLKIINLENDNIKLVSEAIYGKIKIGGSNLSLDELNAKSYTNLGSSKRDRFEIVDMTKERKSIKYDKLKDTYTPYRQAYRKFLDKPIGYIGYDDDNNKGKKYKLIAITKQ